MSEEIQEFYMDLARKQPPTIRGLENTIRYCGIVMAISMQNMEINNPELSTKEAEAWWHKVNKKGTWNNEKRTRRKDAMYGM